MEDKYQVNLKTKENPGGPRLCMAEDSGKGFMEQDGLYFKGSCRGWKTVSL